MCPALVAFMFLSSGLTTVLQFTGPEQINADDDDDELMSPFVIVSRNLVLIIENF